jgi:hypothetical protein
LGTNREPYFPDFGLDLSHKDNRNIAINFFLQICAHMYIWTYMWVGK